MHLISCVARPARLAVFLLAPLAAASPLSALAQAWQPERAVEIIVGTSPGGGQDRSARFVQKLIQDNKLVAECKRQAFIKMQPK